MHCRQQVGGTLEEGGALACVDLEPELAQHKHGRHRSLASPPHAHTPHRRYPIRVPLNVREDRKHRGYVGLHVHAHQPRPDPPVACLLLDPLPGQKPPLLRLSQPREGRPAATDGSRCCKGVGEKEDESGEVTCEARSLPAGASPTPHRPSWATRPARSVSSSSSPSSATPRSAAPTCTSVLARMRNPQCGILPTDLPLPFLTQVPTKSASAGCLGRSTPSRHQTLLQTLEQRRQSIPPESSTIPRAANTLTGLSRAGPLEELFVPLALQPLDGAGLAPSSLQIQYFRPSASPLLRTNELPPPTPTNFAPQSGGTGSSKSPCAPLIPSALDGSALMRMMTHLPVLILDLRRLPSLPSSPHVYRCNLGNTRIPLKVLVL